MSPTNKFLQRQHYFSSVESHWVYKTDLRMVYMPRSRWPTQNEHNDIFVDWFLVHTFWFWIIFIYFYLNLTLLLFLYYGFRFCAFNSLCVCVLCFYFFFLFLFLLFVLDCLLSKEKEKDGQWFDGQGVMECLYGNGWEEIASVIYCVSFQ